MEQKIASGHANGVDLLTRLGINMGTCPSLQPAKLTNFLASNSKEGFCNNRLKQYQEASTRWLNAEVRITCCNEKARVKNNEFPVPGQLGTVVGVGGPASSSISYNERMDGNRIINYPKGVRTEYTESKELEFLVTVKLHLGGYITLATSQVRKYFDDPPPSFDLDD